MQAPSRRCSAARDDLLYEALVRLGRLLRTLLLADHLFEEPLRPPLLRVFNRGESVNASQRTIYTGRVAPFRAKPQDEFASVGDQLGRLANIVMALNIAQMQTPFDRLDGRRATTVPPELLGRIAPTHSDYGSFTCEGMDLPADAHRGAAGTRYPNH